MMPETQDKITEDESNTFHVHFVFIFEAFSMTDGIPKEKKSSMEPSQEFISG